MPRPCFISKKDIRGTICCWRCYEVVHFYIFSVAFLLLLDRLHNAMLYWQKSPPEMKITFSRNANDSVKVWWMPLIFWFWPGSFLSPTERTQETTLNFWASHYILTSVGAIFEWLFYTRLSPFWMKVKTWEGILPTASINLFRSEMERPFSPLHTQMYFEMLRQKMHTRMHFDRILAVV